MLLEVLLEHKKICVPPQDLQAPFKILGMSLAYSGGLEEGPGRPRPYPLVESYKGAPE